MKFSPSLRMFAALMLLQVGPAAHSQSSDAITLIRVEHLAAVPVANELQILLPESQVEVDLNNQQAIVVHWLSSGPVVDGDEITFSTTFGTLSKSIVTTENGFATTYIESPTPGNAIITASNGETAVTVEVRFQPVEPTDDVIMIDGIPVPLDIRNNQVGFQLKTGIPASRAAKIAELENLTFVASYYRDVYVFEYPQSYSRDTLAVLTHQLEEQYPDDIRSAGVAVYVTAAKSTMLMLDEILFGFSAPPTDAQFEAFADTFNLQNDSDESIEEIPGCEGIYIATVLSSHVSEVEDIAALMTFSIDPEVTFAHPNFVRRVERQTTDAATTDVPCDGEYPGGDSQVDPDYCKQWHHDNRAINGGIEDADMDTSEAWEITKGGAHNPLIAIIDSGFSLTHRDLRNNLWTDPLDGERGQDFDDEELVTLNDFASLLDSKTNPSNHGTAVAGIVAGTAYNNSVGRGICPECELLLIRYSADLKSSARSICFAILQNAKVITNSWGVEFKFPATEAAIAQAADDHDIPVLFAAKSVQNQDRCNDGYDLSSLDEWVIGVSSATYRDDRTPSGYGDCIDILGPSRKDQANGIVTTSVRYDNDAEELKNGTTISFGGTSAATPMVAGTIGLMLDVNQDLSRIEIQRVLQDTADKIDPGISGSNPGTAYYNPETGYSDPPYSTATHSFGRVNALEAVALVAPFDPEVEDLTLRTHGGKDLLIRDHKDDWGNMTQPSDVLLNAMMPRASVDTRKSVDIKIDVAPFQDEAKSSADFATLSREDPRLGERMRVYVRLRNRGPTTVNSALVKLHWTHKRPLPPLQADFWSYFPNDPSGTASSQTWVAELAVQLSNVVYSGPSVAGCPTRSAPKCLPSAAQPTDTATIVRFDLEAMDWNKTLGEKLSLLVISHSDEDPVAAKLQTGFPGDSQNVLDVVKWDNNIALWRDTSTACDRWIIRVVVALIMIAIVIALTIIIMIIRRQPVPVRLVIAIIVIIAIIKIIYIRMSVCVINAIDQFVLF